MSDEAAASYSGSNASQVAYLLILMLRLKSWKFLFWIFMLPALFMNFLTMGSLEKRNPDTESGPSVKSLSAVDAAAWKVLITRQGATEATSLKAIAQSRGVASSSDWLSKCGATEECQATFMEAIISLSDATRAFMKFERRIAEFSCLDSSRADLICSYLFHLMYQSMDSAGATAATVFKDVRFVKLFDRYETEAIKREWQRANISAPDSLCTRTAKSSGAFFDYFPRYFMSHMLVVAAATTLYITVGTLSSVAGLKENGFLQLMFCNGLSVAAYWFVVWLITFVEVLLISVLFVVSYGVQCPGFYSTTGLVKSFLTLMCFFIFLASLGLLITTLVGSYFVTLLVMIFLNVLLAFSVLVCRQQVAAAAGKLGSHVSGAMMMLAFPPGNIVEYLLEAMLPSSPANRRPDGFQQYYQCIEILMTVTPIVIIFITIYMDFIVQSGNGLCLPYTYPFNPRFWNPHRHRLIEMVDDQPWQANIEPTVGIPAVITKDVHMTYSSGLCGHKKPPVLKGITCTVYQGQITALIGHNGAGKTTLIRVLMGEEIPSSGVAIINGHRVTDPYQRLALRGSVSICKQVDVLSNYLTVMESMKLTLVAKGFRPDSQVPKVLDMMKRLGLAGKENVQAMDLSGGQMRKVCSIICLLGNPKLVILDEPTSGLDPVSRRNLWQILQDHKAGRSIILCTQFMDEADILADRKIFLSAGKIICAGSSMFLKHAFGCCVSINVSLKSIKFAMPLIKSLKKVKLVGQLQTELLLNVSADKPQFLADAIQVLEEHNEWIEAFGVSQAQLDTIFMRLRSIDLENIEAAFRSKKLRKVGRTERAEAALLPVDYDALYNFESNTPIRSSQLQQFRTLLAMNFHRQRQLGVKFCFRILFPIILLIVIALMVDSERAEAEEANKGIPGSRNQKTSVRVLVQDFHSIGQFGICVFDTDGANEATALQQVTKECNAMFGLTEANVDQVMVVPKSRSVTMEAFLKQSDTMQTMRTLCRISYCFIVHSSTWNRNETNRQRSVHIGQYTIPPDVHIPSEAAISIGHMLTIYLMFSKHFSAIPKTSGPNLTIKRAYTFDTFKSFEFTKRYELLMFVTAFSIVPITYLNDPIEDRDCGIRQHLASMGMRSLAYWLNVFILHWLHYMIYFILSAVACIVWERYQSQFFFINVCLPVLLFGTASSQLSVYVVSALMRKSNAVVIVSYFFFGLFLGVAALYLQNNDTVMLILICIMPQFAPIAYIILSVKLMFYTLSFLDIKSADAVPNLSSFHTSNSNILFALVAMPLHVIILTLLLIIAENPNILRFSCKTIAKNSADIAKTIKDDGVPTEASRINKTARNPVNMLEVRDLQKVYPNGVHAVRGTTFGSFSGEILGLLGPNGAGKTTSMSIIVGEEESSSGTSEVHFSGTWMSGMEGARCGAIGYCPQHNPLFNSISVYEHLCFYAQIRGIPAELAKAQIAGLIDGLGLKPHQAKAAEQLSGGNKRRLCLAISLLGNPSLIVIDEASTGVDPENKRFIWSAIRGMANKQRSVMITTHSMEEVEALCARVGIMNKGLMIGFGTVQQLRSRHGEAFTLDILMKSKKPQKLIIKKAKLTKRMTKQFPNAIVMEDLQRSMQFSLPKKSVPTFSAAMRWLIAKKKKLGMHYFSLYQMSLDQVFVKLVKEYDES